MNTENARDGEEERSKFHTLFYIIIISMIHFSYCIAIKEFDIIDMIPDSYFDILYDFRFVVKVAVRGKELKPVVFSYIIKILCEQ